MAEHIINLSDIEVRGGATLIVRPVMPQPNPSRVLVQNAGGDWCYSDREGIDPQSPTWANPLGIPGDLLLGKEAWGVMDMFLNHDAAMREFNSDEPVYAYTGKVPGHYGRDDIKEHIVYRADNDRQFFWRSASTMPRWAIRWRRPVVEAGVMRVHDLTDSDARAMGVFPAHLYSDMMRAEHGGSEYACAYHEEFNRRWGKRVRFESNPWCFWARVGEEDG